MSVVYDCSCGLIQSCCKWVYISVTSSKPRNLTHPLYSTAGLAKILRSRVQTIYKFRKTLNVNWKVNGWIRTEEHFSLSTIRFCAWDLHFSFYSHIFQYPDVLHGHRSLTELYVLVLWFFVLRIAPDVFMTLFLSCFFSPACYVCKYYLPFH
jgi:hypothetical protein